MRRHGTNPRAVYVLTPHARPNSRNRPRFSPAEKHCAAQAEYGRLAAQAYSPSDAMSQARFCLDGMRKVQRAGDEFGGAICSAETGPCRRRICSRGWGGPPDFPRRRGPRRIAPCGGVVWRGGGPLHPSSCISKMPARLAEPARLKTKAASGSCGLLIPGALDKAAAAAYGAATARPAGPAAAPAGAPGCGRGSTAMGEGRHAAEASAGGLGGRQLVYACSNA